MEGSPRSFQPSPLEIRWWFCLTKYQHRRPAAGGTTHGAPSELDSFPIKVILSFRCFDSIPCTTAAFLLLLFTISLSHLSTQCLDVTVEEGEEGGGGGNVWIWIAHPLQTLERLSYLFIYLFIILPFVTCWRDCITFSPCWSAAAFRQLRPTYPFRLGPLPIIHAVNRYTRWGGCIGKWTLKVTWAMSFVSRLLFSTWSSSSRPLYQQQPVLSVVASPFCCCLLYLRCCKTLCTCGREYVSV